MCSHLSLVDLCENPQMDPQNPLPETPHYNMTPQNSADIWASYQGSFLPPGESSNGEGDRHPWPSMTWNGPVPAPNSTRVPQSERKTSHPLRKAGCESSPSKQPRSSPHIPTARPSSKRQRISPRIRSDEEESVDECLSQSGSQTSCCSSCPDSPPCVEPDCTLAVPCTDRSCEVPVCTAPCLDIASQNQLAFSEHTRRFGNWQDSTWGPQTTEALLRKDPASDKLVDMTLEGACRAGYPVDSSPYSNIPSVVNNDAATPFSTGLSRPNTNYDSQSSYISGVLSGTGALFTHSNGLDVQSFEPVQDVNSSLSFNCPWDGCEQPSFISQDEWLPHLHEQHLDPQLTFRCPIPGDSCPTDIGFDFLGHLEDSHGYNFEDTFNCPAPNCDPSETYYDPSMLHNHFDHAHATPIEGTLHCRLDACNSGFTDPTQLFDHISHFHGLPIKLPSGEDIDLLVPPKTSQDTALLQRNDIPDADALSPVVPESKPDSPDQTTQHVCKWTSAATPCGKICKSEADLQNHVTHDHLNLLDKGTGYNCQWQGCGRRDKRGVKSGFSQRGKLERHMATHTGYKCATCDICGKNFSAEQSMKQHRLLHTGAKPWKCQYCDRSFPQQSACTIHERTHTGNKPLSCNICGKKFSESSNLAKHRKIHGEKGMHSCSYPGCTKSFHRLDQLKRHRLVHTRAEEKIGGVGEIGRSETPMTKTDSEFGSEG